MPPKKASSVSKERKKSLRPFQPPAATTPTPHPAPKTEGGGTSTTKGTLATVPKEPAPETEEVEKTGETEEGAKIEDPGPDHEEDPETDSSAKKAADPYSDDEEDPKIDSSAKKIGGPDPDDDGDPFRHSYQTPVGQDRVAGSGRSGEHGNSSEDEDTPTSDEPVTLYDTYLPILERSSSLATDEKIVQDIHARGGQLKEGLRAFIEGMPEPAMMETDEIAQFEKVIGVLDSALRCQSDETFLKRIHAHGLSLRVDIKNFIEGVLRPKTKNYLIRAWKDVRVHVKSEEDVAKLVTEEWDIFTRRVTKEMQVLKGWILWINKRTPADAKLRDVANERKRLRPFARRIRVWEEMENDADYDSADGDDDWLNDRPAKKKLKTRPSQSQGKTPLPKDDKGDGEDNDDDDDDNDNGGAGGVGGKKAVKTEKKPPATPKPGARPLRSNSHALTVAVDVAEIEARARNIRKQSRAEEREKKAEVEKTAKSGKIGTTKRDPIELSDREDSSSDTEDEDEEPESDFMCHTSSEITISVPGGQN
ncbi:hypothetical protein K491DRAFT_753866 [Lophiostoma macrostomum CBS 122681]|uniref:Uncharacterized protein n=1 Tax=Lophiostoma macrostomum CBS 122681 TaxID=1314788 RepID=A0A6A6TP90_9PLEO|nr:hypothetical protein K491DRAFT_753866 [Lophiostoma macrostomum CBS 122681]